MDTRKEAIKRLVAKAAVKGLSGEKLLDYIVGKTIDSASKRARELWNTEFDIVFNRLSKRDQEFLAYGI